MIQLEWLVECPSCGMTTVYHVVSCSWGKRIIAQCELCNEKGEILEKYHIDKWAVWYREIMQRKEEGNT